MMQHDDAPQRRQHTSDVAIDALTSRVSTRIGADGKILIEPDAFAGRASPYSTGSMGGGVGSVDVTHGYGKTPDPSQIHVVPTSGNGSGWYITDVGLTTFKVNRPATSGTFDFAWCVNPI